MENTDKKTVPGRLLFFDGGFGTLWRAKHGDGTPCEEACLSDPAAVGAIHRAYLEAGAGAILTNSFAVNPVAYPEREKMLRLLSASFSVAREEADRFSALVFADIGPVFASFREASGAYTEVADAFLACGAKNFLFETLDDFLPVSGAVSRLLSREVKEKFGVGLVFVSFSVSEDGYTASGRYYKDLLREAAEAGCHAVGLNCSCGPTHMRNLFRSVGEIPCRLLAMPNAGYPMKDGGRTEYRDNPDFFASRMREIASLGVDCLGGCCGTTPEHIRKTVSLLREKGLLPAGEREMSQKGPEAADMPSPPEKKGKYFIAVELNPPADADFSFTVESARQLRAAGADILTFTDSPLARPRADSVMTSIKIRREAGIETLPHISCRDKNRIALKGSLLCAYAERVNGILALTGDAMKDGAEGKGVFAFDSLRLIEFVSSLNRTVFAASPFRCGGALNVNAENFGVELDRARKKEAAGASFFMTQAIFSDAAAENLRLAHRELSSPVYAGIYPLAGYKNALFLKNEVAGIDVPDRVLEALKDKSPPEEKEIALSFAKETVGKIADFCEGFYISVPLKRIDLALGLIGIVREIPDRDEEMTEREKR